MPSWCRICATDFGDLVADDERWILFDTDCASSPCSNECREHLPRVDSSILEGILSGKRVCMLFLNEVYLKAKAAVAKLSLTDKVNLGTGVQWQKGKHISNTSR